MNQHDNISQMLLKISGTLLNSVPNPGEFQSRLNIVVTAWNMSLLDKQKRQQSLKRLIRKQKGVAPDKDAWKALENEIKQIIQRKLALFPDTDTELVRAESLQTGKDRFEIKVYFKDKEESARQQLAQQQVTNFNEVLAKR